MLPTVSSRGDKLAYSSLSTSLNIWRRDLLHPEAPAVELIPSSRAQWDAQYSPDGKRIAFASLRSGVQGVWISSDDGSNLVQISNPNYASGSPQWSPDGNRIAFDSRPGEPLGNICGRRGRTEAQKTGHKYLRRNSTSLVPRWKVDLFQIRRTWQDGSLSLSRLRRRRHCTIQRYRWDQSAGVFRWEDSIFCKHARQIDAEASRSAGAARYGVQSGWIAST